VKEKEALGKSIKAVAVLLGAFGEVINILNVV
jgi:hypothetical protein